MSSNLNKFVQDQLTERDEKKSASNSKFSLPQFQGLNIELQSGDKIDVPAPISIDKFDGDLKQLKADFTKMQLQGKSQDIDLIKALKPITNISKSKSTSTTTLNAAEGFNLPSTESDRATEIDLSEPCVSDISKVKFNPSLHPPSSLGRVICMKYKRTTPFEIVKPKQNVSINAFQFDTKSPDDIALELQEKDK